MQTNKQTNKQTDFANQGDLINRCDAIHPDHSGDVNGKVATISRQAAIDALKEHRALYCDNTPDTFSKLSYAEKSRVDELDTAIATLVNLPSAQPDLDSAYTEGYTAAESKYRALMGGWEIFIVQKFHDYQIEWLKSHYDLELEPQLEELIIRFLHDTANMYMLDAGRKTDETD